MIEVTPQMTLIVCALILLASFIDSIAGGGGLISLPAYMAVGLPAQYAAGTNKFTAAMGTIIAAVRFGRKKRLVWRVAITSAISALPSSYLGAYLMQLLPPVTSKIILIVIIPISAAIILLRDKLPKRKISTVKNPMLASILIGFSIGFYDGLVGPGTGTFLIILFTSFLDMDDVNASGSAKIVNLASNIAALTSYLLGGHVVWALALPGMCASITGGFLGSGLALKKGAKVVRGVMLAVLVLLIVKLIIDI